MARSVRDQADSTEREGAIPVPSRRWSIATLVALGAALVLLLDGLVGQRGLIENRRAEARYQAAVRALEAARAHNAVLREEARRLREDPAAIEAIARRDLGLMRPGEKLFIVHDVAKAGGGQQAAGSGSRTADSGPRAQKPTADGSRTRKPTADHRRR